jgi:adenylosuccinate synthase
LDEGKRVLFEGAQGTHLDVDHGTYPYVTSSNATAGGACTGTGVGPTRIDRVMGVVKAYTTRVGGGPFPTELTDATGAELQERGNEFGATTGRPRRCGWFDALLARYATRVNGLTAVAVTKLDVLDDCAEIKICTAYRDGANTLSDMPADAHTLEQCEPVYETLPGWRSATTGVTDHAKLPPAAKRYLARIEELIGARVILISTGSRREETIRLADPFLPARG